MLKYYGTPITSKDNRVFKEMFTGERSCLIPFSDFRNIEIAKELSNNIIIDNGAFTTWGKEKRGDIHKVCWKTHWDKYYTFVDKHIEDIEMFFIPDVIDGTEEENDELIAKYFIRYIAEEKRKGVPIWHINESLERLERLVDNFDYIAFGSVGEYAQLGTPKWENKMDKAMRKVCDKEGCPKVKIHMLRCLDPKIFTRYPFYSGDSTSLAQNHSKKGWKNIAQGVEKYSSPKRYDFRDYYETTCLFGGEYD